MNLHYELSEHIGIFTLDNPPVNVWTPELHKRFYELLSDFLSDDEAHVGILTSTGDRAFSAGDDLKTPRPAWSDGELAERYLNGMREGSEEGYPGWEAEVVKLPRSKPIIGAVNGVCLGQGFIYLDRLTDIRIASDNAKFGMVEIAHGMGGAAGGMQLGHSIAHVDAMYLALTGEMIDAKQACDMRLVNEVVAPDELMPRAMAIAATIASHPRLAVRVEMEAYQATQTMNAEQAMSYANHMFRLLRSTLNNPLPLSEQGEGES